MTGESLVKSLSFVVTAMVVAGLLGLGIFVSIGGQSSPGRSTTMKSSAVLNTSTFITTPQTSSGTSSDIWLLNTSLVTGSRLRFELFLNSTSIRSGQGIQIGAELVNLEAQYNTVSNGSSWPIEKQELTASSGCGTGTSPMGLAVMRGYYTTANVSSASSLNFENPTAPNMGCPSTPNSIDYYLFWPGGDYAWPAPNAPSGPLNATLDVNGYWTGNDVVPSSGVFHYFGPGTYTLFAGDEWGDELFLYFTVG